jgi:hypothetical protein
MAIVMATRSVYSTRFKLVASLLVTAAVAAFVAAYLSAREGGNDPILSAGGAGEIVEALIPRRDTQVPQQTTVGIDLVTGWEGTLVLNGTEIPKDQLTLTPELGLIQFTPAKGKAVEELRAGRNCVTAIVWPIAQGREAARNIPWCFEVV